MSGTSDTIKIYEINQKTSFSELWGSTLPCYVIRFECQAENPVSADHITFSRLFFCRPFQFLPQIFGNCVGSVNYVISFTEHYLLQWPHLPSLIDRRDFVFNNTDEGIELTYVQSSELSAIVRLLLGEARSDQGDSQEVVSSCLHTLLLIIRRYKKGATTNSNAYPASLTNKFLVARFHSLLAQQVINVKWNKALDRSVTSLAQQLHIHPNYLNQIVKKVTGNTVQLEIRYHVLGVAKILLKSDLSIKEIVTLLSFKQASHFTNFFKKNALITPSKYRQSG